jgi:two-component system, NtrC family, sensor histidine kinase AtoS
MKKKILVILSVFSLLSLLGGYFLIRAIDTSISRFDELVMLHQVEILREHLMLNIRKVQADLYSQSTGHAKNVEEIVGHARDMEATVKSCFRCHHAEDTNQRIELLKQHIGEFDHALSRVLTMQTGEARRRTEAETAYTIGDELIEQGNTMIALTTRRLHERTEKARQDAGHTRLLLMMLIAVAPLLSIGLAGLLLSGFAKPINALLNATKRLKTGDLDYRVEGLKDEFAELAFAFDDMAASLRERMRELEESEQRYRLLFESAADAIFILDTEGEQAGKIVNANQAAARMHGYTLDELRQLKVQDLDTPEAAAQAPERIKRIIGGEWVKAEVSHTKKDGTVFPLEISCVVFDVNRHKYILAIDRDISERKQAEEAIQRAEHIRTAGELATGLAHEIKNPLAGIKVTMEALSEESTLSPDDRVALSKVIDEIKRIEGLIKGLLNFARPPKPHYTNTDVNSVLEASLQLVFKSGTRLSPESRLIDLKKDFGSDLPEIIADPQQLQQIFMNLLMNAADAMPTGGTLSVKTASDEAARRVTVAISDTGMGMDASVQAKIFQPFFTTKSKGTGLGLAISKRLIEEHGGTIRIESARGAGTTFRIRLPRRGGKERIGDEK